MIAHGWFMLILVAAKCKFFLIFFIFFVQVVMIAHGWFMLILVASYTANLANFLVNSNLEPILGRCVCGCEEV